MTPAFSRLRIDAWVRRTAISLGVALASTPLQRPAAAETAHAGAEAPHPDEVDVVLVGGDAETKAMRAVVEELLARLGVAASITASPRLEPHDVINPPASAQPRLSRAWIDLSNPDRATLYVVDREWERILIRHVNTTPGHEELAREAMGHILENAVDALLHGGRIGIAREETLSELEPPQRSPAAVAERPSAPPIPPSAPRAQSRSFGVLVDWGAAYEAELYASGGIITHGPEATLFVATRSGSIRPGLWLTLQYRFPLSVDAHPLGVRLDAGALRGLAALDVSLAPRIALRIGLGAGVDAVHLTPRPEGASDATVAADEEFVVFVARASVELGVSITPQVALTFALSGDLDPSGTKYVTIVNGASATGLSPWVVRPALSLAVEVQ